MVFFKSFTGKSGNFFYFIIKRRISQNCHEIFIKKIGVYFSADLTIIRKNGKIKKVRRWIDEVKNATIGGEKWHCLQFPATLLAI